MIDPSTIEDPVLDDEAESTELLGVPFEVPRKEYRTLLILSALVFFSTVLIFISQTNNKFVDFDLIPDYQIIDYLIYFITLLGISNIFIKSLFRTPKGWRRYYEWFDLLAIVPILFAVVSVLNAYVISFASVVNISMEPTYVEGDKIISYHLNETYDRGDVVIIYMDTNEYYIKRIIGLPGDVIKIENNAITINGKVYDESIDFYSATTTTCFASPNASTDDSCQWTVPEDSFFVLGDNRNHSLDSRSTQIGFIESDRLYGVVVWSTNQ
jgi:signal peptidase I